MSFNKNIPLQVMNNQKIIMNKLLIIFVSFNLIIKCNSFPNKKSSESYDRGSSLQKSDAIGESNDLERVLQNLDKCIDRKSKSNEENYLELCLQTEISSIIFNVISPYEKQDKADEKQFKTKESENLNGINKYFMSDIVKRHISKRHVTETPIVERNVLPKDNPGIQAGRNIDLIIDHIKRPLQESGTNKTDASSLSKVYRSEPTDQKNVNFDDQFQKYKNPSNINDIQDETFDFKTAIKKLWRSNNIQSLKILLENVKKYLEAMNIDKTSLDAKSKSESKQIPNDKNVNNIMINTSKIEESPHNTSGSAIEQTYEINIARKLKSPVDIFTTFAIEYLLQPVVRYGWEKIQEYSRSANEYETSSVIWNLLKTGFTIASGRGKKDKQPHVISGLILLGVMVPTLFSVVALMAKKALISSLVALALSIYAVTQSKSTHGKQSYEVDQGPLAPPSSKLTEFKSNGAPSSNFDLSSIPIPNIPQHPSPHHDIKYFNPRPPKQHESETMIYKNVEPVDHNNTGYRTRTKPSQDTKSQQDSHEFNHNPTENQYEVTERNDVVRYRRPGRVNDNNYNRYKYVSDQEEFNPNWVTEPYKSPNYDDSEEKYRNVNYPKQSTHEETTRHMKDNGYRGNYPNQSNGQSTRTKYNSYRNSDSYRAESSDRFKGTRKNAATTDQHTANSERNLKSSEKHSTKFTNDDVKDGSFSNDYPTSEVNKYTTEFEPSLETESAYNVEPPPTRKNNPSELYSDSVSSEDVFKPMIVITQAPNNYKNSNDGQTKEANAKVKERQNAINPVNQYFSEEDRLLYQNLNEHEFKRPNPVYKPDDGDKGVGLKHTKPALTLSYIPKIKTTNTNNSSSESTR